MAEGTMTGNLRVKLVVNTQPFPGIRWKLGVKALALIVWLFGMKLTIGVEPEFTIGTIGPAN